MTAYLLEADNLFFFAQMFSHRVCELN